MSKETFGKPTIIGSGQIMQGGRNNQQAYTETNTHAAPSAGTAPGGSDESSGSAEPAEPAESAERLSLLEQAAREQAELARSIFVVYGRDDQANSAVFQLLRRLALKPLEWESLVRGTGGPITPPLSDVVINAPRLAAAAVVVLTPDDMVMLHPELRKQREDGFELRPSLQPRPNVLLELGLVLGVYPQRTLIIQFGDLRPVADLAGLNTIRFHQSTGHIDALRKVAGRLQAAGLPVDDTGSDWLDPTPFQNLKSYRRRPN
jgi:predicted nucleotide-binding protein